MRTIKYINAILLAGLILASCTKKLDEVYLNPNAPVRVLPSELLPPMQYQMAINLQEDFMYMGTTVQVFALRFPFGTGGLSTASNTISRHERMGWFPNVDNSAAIWRMHYWNLGQNLNRMIDWAGEANQWDYVGAGYAMQAWSWLTTTDYHGEMILKEAFRTDQLAFKYDTQEEIYAHVRSLCKQALENFDKPVTASDFAQADNWFFQGDITKWRKFIYGIMARSYSHLSNKAAFNSSYADSVIFYCDKAMQTPAEDASYKYVGGAINNENNYWGRFRANNVNLRQSKYIAELMQGVYSTFNGVDDPRKWYMLTTGTGAYVDSIKGLEVTKGEASIPIVAARPVNFYGSTIVPTVDTARFIFRDNAEFPIMTSTEIQFMKAEAAFRKGNKALALSAYKLGIQRHFEMLLTKYNLNIRPARVMTTNTMDVFLADPRVVPTDPNGLTLSHIMQQKFIALWGHGCLEAWSDLRRYHYTDIDPATGQQVFAGFTPPSGTDLWPDNAGKLSYRVRPRHNSEYVWNIANLAVFGGDKIDYHTKEMWFSLP